MDELMTSPKAMKEMAERLLPCPFCGGSATMEQTENNRWSVGCDSADEAACMGYQNFTTYARRIDATKAWNTRANTLQTPVDSDVREVLQKCVDQLSYFAEDDQPAILEALAAGRAALAEKDKVKP